MKILNHNERCKFSTFVVAELANLDEVAARLASELTTVVKADVAAVSACQWIAPCGATGWHVAFSWRGKDLCLARALVPEQHISNFAIYDKGLSCYFEKIWNPYGGGRPGQWYATTKEHQHISVCGKFRKQFKAESEVINLDLEAGFAPAIEIDNPWQALRGELPERAILVKRDEGQASYLIRCQGSELFACISAKEQWICGVGTTDKISVRTDVKDWSGKCHHRTELVMDLCNLNSHA